ncbi:hemolysin family protein [Candidatus Vampirococcus lugosii]|uniref:Hemolysin n=1 Tax=Candidatus Vampirococcus lugosii TaxID=2789015 RepID=A0ABS5QLK9_9BACT|nr:hemolysin family protein [Candidatus Vampirococcus lugosii]MBS8121611.1 hemolysin [Candidatus Vampirococcus lugosii]
MSEIIIIVLLLFLSAAFSASEIAIMSSPIYKIKQLVNSNSKLARLLLKLRQNSSRTLIVILIGNNLVNVILTIYASSIGDIIVKSFAISGAIGFFAISVLITTLILFFGEIVPKVFANKYYLKYALFISPFIDFLSRILFPFVIFFDFLTTLISKSVSTNDESVSRSDVEIFVDEGEKQGIFSNIESMIVKNLFDFNNRSVDSILKHRTEIFAICSNTKLKDAIQMVLEKPYSRIPIYEEDKDNIIGILNIREMLKNSINLNNLEKKIGDLKLRPVFKLPITANVFDVFLKMKKTGHHFAVIMDEYGGTDGIITFEDILEDMLGDIRDESDSKEESNIVKVGVNELIVRGDVLLREIIMSFNIQNFNIPDELQDKIGEEDMISYIILTYLKSFAKKGEIVKLDTLTFKVIELNESGDKIEKVKVLYTSILK